MLETFNITNTEYDLNRFSGADDLEKYLARYGLDGVELMPVGQFSAGYIPKDRIIGVHLDYHPCWVDFWRGDEAAVVKEFGSIAEAEKRFGGSDRQALVEGLKRQLEFVRGVGARYAVFHVSDVSLEETVSYRFIHTDEQVVSATLELISSAMGAEEWDFDFLVENLWWPGLTMTRPEITRALLEGIPSSRKGIMLDTGHLAHTKPDLSDQPQAVEYILSVLDADPGIEENIRGVHLQCGLTGAFVRGMLARRPVLNGDYQARLGQAFEYVLGIDPHGPFTDRSARRLIDRIAPEYLTHEFISWDLAEATEYLVKQKNAIGRTVDATSQEVC